LRDNRHPRCSQDSRQPVGKSIAEQNADRDQHQSNECRRDCQRMVRVMVNAVRGLTKSCSHRMPASSTRCFAKRSLAAMRPAGTSSWSGTRADRGSDAQDQAVRSSDPATRSSGVSGEQALLKVHGIGHLTAVTFVLTLGARSDLRLSSLHSRLVGNHSVTRPNGKRRVRYGLPVIRPEPRIWNVSCPHYLGPPTHSAECRITLHPREGLFAREPLAR